MVGIQISLSIKGHVLIQSHGQDFGRTDERWDRRLAESSPISQGTLVLNIELFYLVRSKRAFNAIIIAIIRNGSRISKSIIIILFYILLALRNLHVLGIVCFLYPILTSIYLQR